MGLTTKRSEAKSTGMAGEGSSHYLQTFERTAMKGMNSEEGTNSENQT